MHGRAASHRHQKDILADNTYVLVKTHRRDFVISAGCSLCPVNDTETEQEIHEHLPFLSKMNDNFVGHQQLKRATAGNFL